MATTDGPPSSWSVSCERCKKRKVKCCRRVPTCRRCEADGKQCEYLYRRKPGFSSGQRQALESKIRSLEAHIVALEASNEKSQDISSGPCALPNTSNSSNDARDIDSANLTQQGTERIAVSPDTTDRTATSIRTEQIKDLKPSVESIVSSVSLFFRHIHPWLPCLDAQHVLCSLGTWSDPPLALYAVFGACLPFSRGINPDQNVNDSFWKWVKRRILLEALEEPSFVSLEALTIFSLDLSGMTHGPQVWGTLAVLCKMAMHLETSTGYGLRTSAPVASDPNGILPDRDASRRLFWTIYALDSYISITTNLPSQFNNHHIQHLIPARDAIWGHSAKQRPAAGSSSMSSHTVFGYQLELLDISRRLHGLYIEYRRIVDGEEEHLSPRWLQTAVGCASGLSAWFKGLPLALQVLNTESHGKGSSQIPPTLIMLNTYYHAMTLYLHTMLVFPGTEVLDAQLSEFRESSSKACERAVQQVSQIVSSHLEPNADRLGWPFAWSVWIAARYCLVSQHHAIALPLQYFDTFVSCLDRMSCYWQVSEHYCRLLRLAIRDREGLSHVDDAGDRARLLRTMICGHLTTAELEDQARVDPILSESTPSTMNSYAVGYERYGDGALRVDQPYFPRPATGPIPYDPTTRQKSASWLQSQITEMPSLGPQTGSEDVRENGPPEYPDAVFF